MSAGKHSSSLSEQQVSVLTQMLRSQLAAFPACKATLEDLLHPNANTPLGHQVRPLFAIDPDYHVHQSRQLRSDPTASNRVALL